MSWSAKSRGALCGLAAAALFGLSAPLAKPLLGSTGPLTLAALLYLGGGLALTVASALRGKSRAGVEAPLRRRDIPRLGLLILCGGVIGPVLMLVALERASASSVSLLLNLEGPFTLALAALAFGEHVGWRGLASVAAVVAGAVVLGLPSGPVRLEPVATPEGFTGTTALISAELYVPLGAYAALVNDFESHGRTTLAARDNHALVAVGQTEEGRAKLGAARDLMVELGISREAGELSVELGA